MDECAQIEICMLWLTQKLCETWKFRDITFEAKLLLINPENIISALKYLFTSSNCRVMIIIQMFVINYRITSCEVKIQWHRKNNFRVYSDYYWHAKIHTPGLKWMFLNRFYLNFSEKQYQVPPVQKCTFFSIFTALLGYWPIYHFKDDSKIYRLTKFKENHGIGSRDGCPFSEDRKWYSQIRKYSIVLENK